MRAAGAWLIDAMSTWAIYTIRNKVNGKRYIRRGSEESRGE